MMPYLSRKLMTRDAAACAAAYCIGTRVIRAAAAIMMVFPRNVRPYSNSFSQP
jgi:hypothetical protein